MRKHFKAQKVNMFWNFIKNKVKVVKLGVFLQFCLWQQLSENTKKHMFMWYLLNCKWCEVRIKTVLVSSTIDHHGVGYSEVNVVAFLTTFNVFWWKNFLFICYKQFKNYEPLKLNLSYKIFREYLYAIFAL